MQNKLQRPLLLMGCGKMGGAMLDGWLTADIAPAGVVIVDPFQQEKYLKNPNIKYYSAPEDLPDDLNPEIVILAVKPQQMDSALEIYRMFVNEGTTFISIAAGKTISYFEEKLGGNAAVIRAMPNTPAAIGQGISVACGNKNVSTDQLELGLLLLKSVGEAYSVDDESLLDPVTALSGGGPAYTFLMIEAMSQAGISAGLPESLSKKLALFTIAGSGQLALQSDEEPAQLRKNVTSPNGTTLEALNILMAKDGLTDLMTKAIQAATDRSKELAK